MFVEESQVQPCARGSVAGIDGGSIFPLCQRIVFLLLRDTCVPPVRLCRIKLLQLARLLLGLIAPTANDSGGLEIELSQVGSGVNTLRIQVHCGLEFARDPACQSRSRKETRPI